MKRYNMILIVVALLMLFSIGQARENYIPTGVNTHLNVAQMGMGGLTTVVSTNAHTIFYNPALLTRQKFALEITPISIGLGSDLQDVTDFVSDHSSDFAAIDTLSDEAMEQFLIDSESFDNQWMGIQVEPYFGLAFRNFGIGAYANVNTAIKMDQGVFVPAVGARGYMDNVFGAGYSRMFNIMGKDIGIGATVRIIQRQVINNIRVSASDVAESGDMAKTIIDSLPDAESGFGLDVGAVHALTKNMDVAVCIQDLVGSLDGTIKPNFKTGAMYYVPMDGSFLLKSVDVGFEVVDLFNRQGVSFFQKINMGTELNMLAGFFKLRGGFHQGYPTAGIGLRLLILQVDAAYFTRELGSAPGVLPDESVRLQVSIGW